MKIHYKNNYFSLINGISRFCEVKASLSKQFARYFAPMRGLDHLSNRASDRVFYPVVAQGYRFLGLAVSRSLSLLSENLGNRVLTAWSDPIPTSFLVGVSNYGQKILSPIANCKPSTYPILRPITQIMIGLARFTDIALKDASTVLNLPDKAVKVFTERPWEAFVTEHKTFFGRTIAAGFFGIYGVVWFAIATVDFTVRIFQSIAYKIRMGRGITDLARDQVEGVEKRVRNYFIGKILIRESQARKLLVGGMASGATQNTLRLLSTITYRTILGYGLLTLISSQIRAYDPTNSLISPEVEQGVAWLASHATVTAFTVFNIGIQLFASAAFFKEFMNGITPEYNPDKQSLFYRKNPFQSLVVLKRIIKHAKTKIEQ